MVSNLTILVLKVVLSPINKTIRPKASQAERDWVKSRVMPAMYFDMVEPKLDPKRITRLKTRNPARTLGWGVVP